MTSKRFVFLVTAALAAALLTAPAVAQDDDPTPNPKWQLGLKAGFNLASFSGDSPGLWLSGPEFQVSGTLLDDRTGFVGGGYVRWQVSPRFALQLDGLYSQKGGSGTVSGQALIDQGENAAPLVADVNGTMTAMVDYIEFPILAMATLPSSDNTDIALYGGLGMGFVAYANTRIEGEARTTLADGSARTQEFDQLYNVREEVRDTDVTGILGANIEWTTGHGRITLEARYSFSLRTIDQTGESQVGNSVFAMMIGFGWPKGGDVEEN
jgi:opacity protein-like surface antigen